jgi:hypothetical protein
LAQLVHGVYIKPRRSLLIEKRDGVAMKTRVTSHITDFELSLPHQSGHMALNHFTLDDNILLGTIKST